MRLTPKEDAFVRLYVKHGADETLIAKDLDCHPSLFKALLKNDAVQAAITAARESWSTEPSESELLAEVLHMARKANAMGRYSAASIAYDQYGRRAFGWRSETRTELVGKDGGPIEMTQVREQLLERLDRIEASNAISDATGSAT